MWAASSLRAPIPRVTSDIRLVDVPNRQRRCRCSYGRGGDNGDTPRPLKVAVSVVTELLRAVLSGRQTLAREDYTYNAGDESLIRGVDDVLSILRWDYEQAYFLTGKDLYSQNLELLVPFFDQPSLGLKKLEKGVNDETESVVATWSLRTYLKLPWKPLISIEGTTVYDLDNKFKIVRHRESWNISAFQAILQIFTPRFRKTANRLK